MRTCSVLLIGSLLLSACSGETRRITVVTPFSVRSQDQSSNMLWAGVMNEATSLTENPPIGLPIGLGSQYCYQADLRMSYTDSRPGYPSFSGRLNLITKEVADPATPWSPTTGPVGLTDAISMLRDPNLSFLPSPITLDLPVNSRGTIRIVGTLVRPSGLIQAQIFCPYPDFNSNGVPNISFAVWGETQIEPGGPSTLTVPVNVISTTPLSGIYSTPYSTPSPSGNQVGNDSLRIKCRNSSNLSSCMNRGLMEFRFKIQQSEGAVNSDYLIESQGVRDSENYTTKLRAQIPSSGEYNLYLPKRNKYSVEYFINYFGTPSKVEISLNFGEMTYTYMINYLQIEGKRQIKDCGGGKFGVQIPTYSNSSPLPNQNMVGNCTLGDSNGPNVIISDLGYGF